MNKACCSTVQLMLPSVFKLKKRVGRWLCMHEVLKCMHESTAWMRVGRRNGDGWEEDESFIVPFCAF